MPLSIRKHQPGQPVRVDVPHPPGELSDEELFAAYRRGDRAGFQKLLERYQRELFHFLVRFLGDRSTAEDIFQETFLQVHQSASQFDPQRRFRPWLFTIAANKARDLIRSQARRPSKRASGHDSSRRRREWGIHRSDPECPGPAGRADAGQGTATASSADRQRNAR